MFGGRVAQMVQWQQLVTKMNRKLWRYAATNTTERYLLHRRVAYPFRHLRVAVDDPAVVESFTFYNQQPQTEHVIWFKQPLLFEPTYGFALAGATSLLVQSMPYYEQVGVPALLPYMWRRFAKREPIQHERCVISLREFGDGNYYHFYSDVLGRLQLLQRWPETANMPIIVSERLYNRPYFQDALRRSSLHSRRWIVHGHGFIQADEAILCKVMPHARSSFDYLLDLLNAPPADPHAERRVFLTRQPSRGRYVENQEDVLRVCAEFGFELVDTDQMDFAAQIECFRTTRYLVGIHGAGLVNMLYRRGAPLALLELFPPDSIPPHYFWICQAYGFGYNALVGSPGHVQQAFKVDPERLKRNIEAMLAGTPHGEQTQ